MTEGSGKEQGVRQTRAHAKPSLLSFFGFNRRKGVVCVCVCACACLDISACRVILLVVFWCLVTGGFSGGGGWGREMVAGEGIIICHVMV